MRAAMNEFSNPFNSPAEQLRSYVESLRAALGDRDPMTVLEATAAGAP